MVEAGCRYRILCWQLALLHTFLFTFLQSYEKCANAFYCLPVLYAAGAVPPFFFIGSCFNAHIDVSRCKIYSGSPEFLRYSRGVMANRFLNVRLK